VCDFGLGRIATAAVKLTGGRGSVRWMAPEGMLCCLSIYLFYLFMYFIYLIGSLSNSCCSCVCYVLSYHSPRVVIEHAHYTNKMDVYSFAIVMWELCSRRVPFPDLMDDMEIAKAVMWRDARPQMPDTIPACLQNLIKDCWVADPNVRPSFSDVLVRLRQPDFMTEAEAAGTVPFVPMAPQFT